MDGFKNLKKFQSKTNEFGVEIENIQIRDITFPKSIQELFARHSGNKNGQKLI